jgi:alanine racemase
MTMARAWAEIDLAAVRHNARLLRRIAVPAALCAVVKANAYGHGAVPVARAALQAGATWLAVATVEEGVELRDAGITAPVLLLSEPPNEAMEDVLGGALTPTLCSFRGILSADEAAARRGVVLDVHVKVDTGMHRIGADPGQLAAVVSAVTASSHLRYGGLWTHMAVADGTREEDRAFTTAQLERFLALRHELSKIGHVAPLVHAANSAATIHYPESRLHLVRCGIALYGSQPSFADYRATGMADDVAIGAAKGDSASGPPALRPVMSLRAKVSYVREVGAGERPSYGRMCPLDVPSFLATVPIGYADGLPRQYFFGGGTVLVGGRRRRLAGAVTMDQIVVDCGPDATVSVGDDVVLIGSQGNESITAWDWAGVLKTIPNEVLSRIGPRVPRVVVDSEDRR